MEAIDRRINNLRNMLNLYGKRAIKSGDEDSLDYVMDDLDRLKDITKAITYEIERLNQLEKDISRYYTNKNHLSNG
jgi:hypothetical protein